MLLIVLMVIVMTAEPVKLLAMVTVALDILHVMDLQAKVRARAKGAKL